MDWRLPLLQDPETPAIAGGRGALAPEERGGLSRFLGQVADGANAVMSHPLYQRLWSGAVSGQLGNPMAGPQALESLRPQAPSIQDELNVYRLRQMQRAEDDARRDRQAREGVAAALATEDPRQISAAMARLDPMAAATRFLEPAKSSPLKAINTPEGPRYVAAQDAIGQVPYTSGGVVVTMDENGRPVVQVGGAPLSSSTRGKVEEKQVNAQDTLARIEGIRSAYRPEFQQWGTKLNQRYLQAKDSAGVDLSPAERTQLTEMANFQGNAYETMSYILNQLSGAAISPAEFERLKAFLPNVGSGVFDGDSPATFQAKLDRFDQGIRLALIRYEYAKQNGLDTGGIPLTVEELSKRVGPDALRSAGIAVQDEASPLSADQARALGLE